MALLAGTMLTIPLAGDAKAKTNILPAKSTASGQTGFSDVVGKARPAVVSIMVKKSAGAQSAGQFNFGQEMPDGKSLEEFFDRFGLPRDFAERFNTPKGKMKPQMPSRGQGSGFFISSDGYVVTNHHVVAGADDIKVRTQAGKTLDARLIGSDPKTDLAVLKVEGKDFPTVSWGDSDDVNAGDWVITVGNPFGLTGTTTAGIVSARGRDIGSGLYDFIQIDAPINAGNSGGPAFNTAGEVIGVNTAIFSPSGGNVGIGFAIPSDTAKSIVAELISDGSIERAWLGVMIQPVTKDIATSFGFDEEKGALVVSVTDDSPAARAELQSGDVILSVDGKSIKDVRALMRLIAEMDPETRATLSIWRGDKTITKTVALGEQPGEKVASAASMKKPSKLGLMLKDGRNGVVVAGVEPGSPAAEKGLKDGDIITRANGREVKTAKDVRDAVASAKNDGKSHVRFLIKGQNGNRFVALKMKRA